MYNICILKPREYAHSFAFWELAELIAYAIRDNGHHAKITINEIFNNEYNIIFGAHLLKSGTFPENTIIFNTEQLGPDIGTWTDRILNYGKKHVVWDYSKKNVELFKSNGVEKIVHVPIGYHQRLDRIEHSQQKDIDVLFYGIVNERQHKILSEVHNSGLKVKALAEIYGAPRDEYISRSNLVLNLHQHETKIFEVVRVSYLINNAIPVVCEIDEDTYMEDGWEDIVHGVSYPELADECKMLLDDPARRQEIAEASYEIFKKRDQVEYLESALSNSMELAG